MMKYIKYLSITFFLFVFSVKIFADPTGMVLYGESDGLKYRIYDNQYGLGDEYSVPEVTVPVNFIRADACPTRPEVIVLALGHLLAVIFNDYY